MPLYRSQLSSREQAALDAQRTAGKRRRVTQLPADEVHVSPPQTQARTLTPAVAKKQKGLAAVRKVPQRVPQRDGAAKRLAERITRGGAL